MQEEYQKKITKAIVNRTQCKISPSWYTIQYPDAEST